MPTKLKAVKQKIISVSLGPEHAACLTEAGHIVTFGSNTAAQLGRGHSKQGVMPGVVSRYIHSTYLQTHQYLHIYSILYYISTPTLQVRAGGLGERVVGVVECGASFTVAATVDNVLLFWGTRWHT